MFIDWNWPTDLIIKKSFGGGNCFNKIRIFLNIVLQFLSPLVLHPGPNHNPIRHLAQLTTSSPKFLSLCIQVIILSLFSSLMGPFVPFPCAGSPYFFQTTKCFRCHSVSVIGHFLSFVLLLWVVIHGWCLQKSVSLVWLLLWNPDHAVNSLLNIHIWMLHLMWLKHIS